VKSPPDTGQFRWRYLAGYNGEDFPRMPHNSVPNATKLFQLPLRDEPPSLSNFPALLLEFQAMTKLSDD
jgi:hypothetical protein